MKIEEIKISILDTAKIGFFGIKGNAEFFRILIPRLRERNQEREDLGIYEGGFYFNITSPAPYFLNTGSQNRIFYYGAAENTQSDYISSGIGSENKIYLEMIEQDANNTDFNFFRANRTIRNKISEQFKMYRDKIEEEADPFKGIHKSFND